MLFVIVWYVQLSRYVVPSGHRASVHVHLSCSPLIFSWLWCLSTAHSKVHERVTRCNVHTVVHTAMNADMPSGCRNDLMISGWPNFCLIIKQQRIESFWATSTIGNIEPLLIIGGRNTVSLKEGFSVFYFSVALAGQMWSFRYSHMAAIWFLETWQSVALW